MHGTRRSVDAPRWRTCDPRLTTLADEAADYWGPEDMDRDRVTLDPEALAAQYAAGASYRALAERHGVHESTIRRHLDSADSRAVGAPRLPVSDDEILTLHRAGWSQREIAREVGMSRGGVRKRLAAYD